MEATTPNWGAGNVTLAPKTLKNLSKALLFWCLPHITWFVDAKFQPLPLSSEGLLLFCLCLFFFYLKATIVIRFRAHLVIRRVSSLDPELFQNKVSFTGSRSQGGDLSFRKVTTIQLVTESVSLKNTIPKLKIYTVMWVTRDRSGLGSVIGPCEDVGWTPSVSGE